MTDDAERFASHFRLIARLEFALSSPLYERLAVGVADRFDLISPLAAAPVTQQSALLYFAAVGYLLRTRAAGHPLAAWMPTLGGTRAATDGDPLAALADLVGAHREEIAHLCATRMTQTNEAARAAVLRPAFGRAAELIGGKPMALVEIGTSAGLLLVPDRYRYRYHDGSRIEIFGDGALTIDCEIRGDGWPTTAGVPLAIASRTGIDLNPIHWADADAVTWLHACVWPEHTARNARLDAALAEVAAAAPTLIADDVVAALPRALAAVDPASIPVVFGSHVLPYLTPEARAEVVRAIDAAGRSRELITILNEGAGMLSSNWFAANAREVGTGVRTQVTIVHFCDGDATVEVQSEGGAHGTWLEFDPRRYAYAPPTLAR